MPNRFEGFSKLPKEKKIDLILETYFKKAPEKAYQTLQSFWQKNPDQQKIFDALSENTLSNFHLPFGVCPQLMVNDEIHCVPMVTEESSVVAAASKAGKFWLSRGGFNAKVVSTRKIGQIHLLWSGEAAPFKTFFEQNRQTLVEETLSLTGNMQKRGGGLVSMKLLDKTRQKKRYYQIWCEFETCDAMGANFINSVLEQIADHFKEMVNARFKESLEIVMAILSNYNPDCLVKVRVRCPVFDLEGVAPGISPRIFARRFQHAVHMANIDRHRAVTHNKGIFNGVDAVVLATGNDFRAVEACGHAFAARNGQYRSLSQCEIEQDLFSFQLEIPLSLGKLGGITSLHPLAKLSFELLGRPTINKLMKIAAATGLAQNFAAVTALITTGIQKGHMKLHLLNILNFFNASPDETASSQEYFNNRVISYPSVKRYLDRLRNWI